VTAYVSLDNESSGITTPPASLQSKKIQAAKKDAADVSTKRPVDEGSVSLNTNEVLMLHRRLKIIQERGAQGNKTARATFCKKEWLMEHVNAQINQKDNLAVGGRHVHVCEGEDLDPSRVS
jgi:hypothetical protein